jgi:hypothetical protein
MMENVYFGAAKLTFRVKTHQGGMLLGVGFRKDCQQLFRAI